MILTNRLTLAKVRCEQPALLGLRFCVPWDTNSEPPFSSPASTYRSACCSCSTLEVKSLSTSQDASFDSFPCTSAVFHRSDNLLKRLQAQAPIARHYTRAIYVLSPSVD